MADYLPPVVLELEGRHEKLFATLNRARQEVRKFAAEVGRTEATVNVKADLSRFRAAMEDIRRQRPPEIRIKVQVDARSLTEARQKVKDGPAARMRVELDLASGQREKLKEQVARQAISAPVKPVLDRGEAQRVKAYLDAFKEPIRVLVKPTLDVPAARRVAALLDAFKEPITATIRPDVSRESAQRTRQRLDILTHDRIVNIRTRVQGGSGSLGEAGRGGVGWMGALISLAPALAPITASLGSVALSAASAGVAVVAFGAAVIPQIKALGQAADAQDKYSKAVAKYGPGSKQAMQAQEAFQQSLEGMPPATRQAAGAFLVLKEHFKGWSDSLAGFTMKPVTQGMAAVDALLPKLSPLVQATSTQFARLTTLLAGGINSGAFDGIMSRFTAFTNGVLTRGVDGIVHFSRVLSEGRADGPIRQFLDYAHQVGPQVRETLTNLWHAVSNLLKASSEAGPGILSLVNALAQLVASLPASWIARAMQAFTALKLITLTRAGFAGAAGSIATLSTRIAALRAASLAAGGGMAGLRAAFASLGMAAKATIVLAAIAAVSVAVAKLASLGRKAPPDIDKLTNSLGRMGRTGQVNGEALNAFGKNLVGLRDAVKSFVAPSVLDHIQQGIIKVFTLGTTDSTPVKEAKENLQAIDQALGDLVQNGHADLAAAALEKLKAAYGKGGHDVGAFTSHLKEYKKAVDDAKFAQELAAQSQGLFGDQAQAVQQKLDAQKASTDGLRQSIQALNDVNRSALDGEIGFEAAIDAAAKAAKDNGKALAWRNGHLVLGTEKARNEAQALSDLAAKTDANTAAARDNGASWSTVSGIYQRGREKLVAAAQQMGLTRDQAKALADQILRTPDKTAMLRGDITDLQKKLDDARAKLASVPTSKRSALLGNIADLENKIAKAKADLAALNGRTATTYVNTVYTPGRGSAKAVMNATGSIVQGGVRMMADGGFGRPAMMAKGGSNILWGEGPDESYIPHTRNPRSRAIAERTVGILGGSVSWGGGASAFGTMGAQVAAGLGGGMASQTGALAAQARALALAGVARPIADALEIASPSKVTIRFGRWVGHGMVQGLTGTTSQVKAAAKKVGDTVAVMFGSHSHLSRLVDADNRRLLGLAEQRDRVAKRLKDAQKHLADLRKSWSDKRNEIASGIMSGVSVIAPANETGRPVNAQDVLANLKKQAQKAIQFAQLLKQLRSKGLRSDLIQQLAAAGPEQGYDTALALAGGSSGQIREVNATQKSLVSAANSTGAVVADAMYGAGIKSAQGLVKGLASQEKAIERQMMRIAKSMEAAIKKALGIHSPSRVMAELGDYTALGMAVGIDRSSKHAAIAAQGMAMSVRQAASLATSNGRLAVGSSLAAAAGGGGGQHFEVHIHVAGSVLSERELRTVVEQQMLRLGMRNSSTWVNYSR